MRRTYAQHVRIAQIMDANGFGPQVLYVNWCGALMGGVSLKFWKAEGFEHLQPVALVTRNSIIPLALLAGAAA